MDQTIVFVVEVTELNMKLASTQGDEATPLLSHVLHSLAVDARMVRKTLRSMWASKEVYEKAVEHKILKNEFKKSYLTVWWESDCQVWNRPYTSQWDVVKV